MSNTGNAGRTICSELLNIFTNKYFYSWTFIGSIFKASLLYLTMGK